MKNHKAKIFDRAYETSGMYYGWELREEFILHFEKMDLRDDTVLDLGAGEGRYSLYLAERGCVVTAVDFSDAGLRKLENLAARKGARISTIVRDLRDYRFEEARYDIVVAATILDHLEDEIRARIISGIMTTLKPGGILYANVFTTSDPGYRSIKEGDQSVPGISDTSTGMAHYFAPGELKACFPELQILFHLEGAEPDLSHGTPHTHGWASIIGRKND